MTSRENAKYWYTSNELAKIIGDCQTELQTIMKLEKQQQEETDNKKKTSGKKSKKNDPSEMTARGLEQFYDTDQTRMKQREGAVHAVLTINKMKKLQKKLKKQRRTSDSSSSDSDESDDNNNNDEYGNIQATKSQLRSFYQQCCDESARRALKLGKLDELSVIKYMKTTELEMMHQMEQEQQQAEGRENAAGGHGVGKTSKPGKPGSWTKAVRKSWPFKRTVDKDRNSTKHYERSSLPTILSSQ